MGLRFVVDANTTQNPDSGVLKVTTSVPSADTVTGITTVYFIVSND